MNEQFEIDFDYLKSKKETLNQPYYFFETPKRRYKVYSEKLLDVFTDDEVPVIGLSTKRKYKLKSEIVLNHYLEGYELAITEFKEEFPEIKRIPFELIKTRLKEELFCLKENGEEFKGVEIVRRMFPFIIDSEIIYGLGYQSGRLFMIESLLKREINSKFTTLFEYSDSCHKKLITSIEELCEQCQLHDDIRIDYKRFLTEYDGLKRIYSQSDLKLWLDTKKKQAKEAIENVVLSNVEEQYKMYNCSFLYLTNSLKYEFIENCFNQIEIPNKTNLDNNRTSKLIMERLNGIDGKGWHYVFPFEKEYIQFVSLLTTHFEGEEDVVIPKQELKLTRDCKTKFAKFLQEIHADLAEQKLSKDEVFLKVVKTCSHFKNEINLVKCLSK